MGSSLIFQSESYAPKITPPNAPTDWIDATTLTIDATDYGLGVKALSANADGWQGAAIPPPPCLNAEPNANNAPGQPHQGDRNNRCRQTETLSIPTASMPEGSYQVALTAADILDNPATSSMPVKIDHTAPQLTITGALKDAEGSFARDGDTANIVATDAHSGARSLRVSLDGAEQSTKSCATDGCTLSDDLAIDADTLDEGLHTVSVTATDGASHTATKTWTFSIDKTRPDIYATNTLWDLADGVTADDEISVDLDGIDGDEDLRESGVDRIEVLVDGAQVATVPATGCGPSNCQLSTSWTLRSADYSEGEHTITYRVVDRVGLSDTETQQITLDRITGEPSQSSTVAEAAALRIDGANGSLLGLGGDLLGSAVADIGDVNEDGIDDFAVGAPGAQSSAGAVYVIYGGQSGAINVASLTVAQGFVIRGATLADAAGSAVASAGDVDGDGKQDMLIGAPGASLLNSVLPGNAYVIFGGRCNRTIELANLGACGFSITGPALTLSALLKTIPGFGAQVTGPRNGGAAPSADVNGDGRDDIVLGAPRGSQNSRDASGSTYVIYGKTDASPVDVASLGGRGFRIDGASGDDVSGTSAAPVGDVNADGFADVLVGAPGATSTGAGESVARPGSGKAYVVYGSSTPTNIDLAALNSGYQILGKTADKIGATVTALGDLDGDNIDDVAIGGRGAFIVTGHDNTDDAIDLADPDMPGWRVEPPAGAGNDAIVTGAADLNDDQLTDLVVSYPSLGRAWSVYTQETLLNTLPQASAIDGSPGQRSTRYTANQTADGTGAAVDTIETLDDGRSGIIIGAPKSSPQSRASAGSAFVVAGRQSAAAPPPPAGRYTTLPDGTPPKRGPGVPAGEQPDGVTLEPKCAPALGYQFFDPPKTDGSGGFTNQNFHFFGCVRTAAGVGVKTPRNVGCGKRAPDGCKQSSFKTKRATLFRSRLLLQRRLIDTDLPPEQSDGKQHMVQVADKDSPFPNAPPGTPGIAMPQDSNPATNPDRREYAWPIRDSFGEIIGYIRQVPPRAKTSTQPAVARWRFRLWNNEKRYMGSPTPSRKRLEIQGRPCGAGQAADPETNVLIYLSADGGAPDLQGNPVSVRGLLSRRALKSNALAKTSNDKVIDAYWAPCKRPKKAAGTIVGTYVVPDFRDRTNSLYISISNVTNNTYLSAYQTAEQGTPMLNNTWPQGPVTSPPTTNPQYPPHVVLSASPSTVTAGGLPRGVMMSNRTVVYVDGFKYLDPNIGCAIRENWSWNLIRRDGIYAYVPRRTADPNETVAPLPLRVPYNPATYNPKFPAESYRPCK